MQQRDMKPGGGNVFGLGSESRLVFGNYIALLPFARGSSIRHIPKPYGVLEFHLS